MKPGIYGSFKLLQGWISFKFPEATVNNSKYSLLLVQMVHCRGRVGARNFTKYVYLLYENTIPVPYGTARLRLTYLGIIHSAREPSIYCVIYLQIFKSSINHKRGYTVRVAAYLLFVLYILTRKFAKVNIVPRAKNKRNYVCISIQRKIDKALSVGFGRRIYMQFMFVLC